MKWKWKRAEPGVYECGPWMVSGERTTWSLYKDGLLVFGVDEVDPENSNPVKSKKEAQQWAENNPDWKPATQEEYEDEIEEPSKSKIARRDSLESVIASFRLEVSRLTDTIGLLSNSVEELSKKLK